MCVNVIKSKYVVFFHSLIISIYVSIKSDSTCKQASILLHHRRQFLQQPEGGSARGSVVSEVRVLGPSPACDVPPVDPGFPWHHMPIPQPPTSASKRTLTVNLRSRQILRLSSGSVVRWASCLLCAHLKHHMIIFCSQAL